MAHLTFDLAKPGAVVSNIAKAVCIKNGKRTACYRIDVTDEHGNSTATVTTTGYYV